MPNIKYHNDKENQKERRNKQKHKNVPQQSYLIEAQASWLIQKYVTFQWIQ